MNALRYWLRLKALAQDEWRQLTTIHVSDRPWQMPFAAALASGLPLLVGVGFGHLDYGLISSLAGLVFLYLPATPLYHRMVSLMACAFAMTASYALGVASHLFPPLMTPMLAFTTILVTMVCRFYKLGPPGSLFFIMAASIGAYAPGDLLQIPLKVGIFFLGSLQACLIAFIYSIHILRSRPAVPVTPISAPSFDFVVFDSIVIGTFVGASQALAQALHMDNAYWVPVSCLAVVQGMSLRAVWTRQLHRILGTGIGLGLAGALLMLPLDQWSIALIMMLLAFIIELAVVRHYGFAVVFITPLTILLAEAATMGHGSPAQLMQARFFDTLLGCLVGLLGGICLHSPRFRRIVGCWVRAVLPARFGN